MIFSSSLTLFPGNERRNTRGRKLNSREDSWTQMLPHPKSSPLHPVPRASPASRVQPLTNSRLLATQSRALTQNTTGLQADVQAEPPTGIVPQTFREQPPEGRVVSRTVLSDSMDWAFYLAGITVVLRLSLGRGHCCLLWFSVFCSLFLASL